MGDIVEAASTSGVLRGDRGAFTVGRECQREALAIVEQYWETIVAVAAEFAEAPDGVLDGDAVREAVRSAEPVTRP